ncbi:hypothetical protein D3C80_1191870 [compost metagenome]
MQAEPGQQAQAGEQPQPQLVIAGVLLDGAKPCRQQKAADTAGHADQPGHYADFLAEALWHQLEYRAITSAQAQHGADEQCQCGGGRRQVETDCGNADGGHAVHAQQGADAAEAVGQGAAERAHQAAGEHAGSGVVAGSDRAQPVLVAEVAGQGAGQANEAAEGDTVEEHEPPAVTVAEGLEVVRHCFGLGALWGVACQQGEHHQRQRQRNQRKAEHIVPAKAGRQRRGQQGGEHRAGIAGASNAHGLALVLRRVPLRRQRQRHGERSAGKAEEQAQQQHLFIAVYAEVPGRRQRDNDHHLADQPCGLG